MTFVVFFGIYNLHWLLRINIKEEKPWKNRTVKMQSSKSLLMFSRRVIYTLYQLKQMQRILSQHKQTNEQAAVNTEID